MGMSINTVKQQAAKIAAAEYYVSKPDCLCSGHALRSATHGGKLWATSGERAAYRAGIRWAVGSMRYSRSAAGRAAQLAEILNRPDAYLCREAAAWLQRAI